MNAAIDRAQRIRKLDPSRRWLLCRAIRTGMNMTCATVALFGLALASCSGVSSNLPISYLLPAPAEATLTIDSTPQGALASASIGGTCVTPCLLSAPVITDPFTVTYTLDGYLPETVSVRPIPVEKTALIDMTPARLEPNPVLVELRPAPPPPPEPPPVKRRPRP
jgi:hypothetical protein